MNVSPTAFEQNACSPSRGEPLDSAQAFAQTTALVFDRNSPKKGCRAASRKDTAMARSQRLRLRDLRAIFQLSGECRELGADPVAWRRHMQRELCQLVGGQITLYTESLRRGQPGSPDWLPPQLVMDSGWSNESDRRAMFRLYEEGRPDSDGSCFTREFALATAPRLLTTRRRLLADAPWYQGRFFNEYIRAGRMDDSIVMRHEQANEIRLLVIHRALNEEPFQAREIRIARVFSVELQSHFGITLARREGVSVADLSPRQREVLRCLLEGDSEKQAARRLNISPLTVHDHVKALHKRFGVSSRGELLARCQPLERSLMQSAVSSNNGA